MRFRWRPGAGSLLRVVRSLGRAALAVLAGVVTAAAADPPSCRTVRLADVGWTAETATTAVLEGQALPLRASPAEGAGLIVADIETPLRQLIQWCRSGNPVLLAEGGAVRGVCGPTEVIRALATSDARSRAPS